MGAKAFHEALSEELPVVFVNIGWAVEYDGSEAIVGNHRHIQEHPGERVGESKAFRETHGYFECGMGSGAAPERFHAVFVARDPGSRLHRVVGLYADAEVEIGGANWAFASTYSAVRIPVNRRPIVTKWPRGQGMRRWALHPKASGKSHKSLENLFAKIRRMLKSKAGLPIVLSPADEDGAFEGELGMYYGRHRRREHLLRFRKIAEVLNRRARLVCEVPKCKFDFQARYGELGAGFAEVHHLKPLKDAPKRGQYSKLSDLAIVCSNCHRMLHQNGDCRPLRQLKIKRVP
jgi:hypothetical protein